MRFFWKDETSKIKEESPLRVWYGKKSFAYFQLKCLSLFRASGMPVFLSFLEGRIGNDIVTTSAQGVANWNSLPFAERIISFGEIELNVTLTIPVCNHCPFPRKSRCNSLHP